VLGLCFAGWVFLFSPTGATQSAEEHSEVSKRYYDEGRALFETGEFERAAEKLRQAYALTPKPLILYNVSLAEWKAGNVERAADAASRASREGLGGEVGVRNDARRAAFGVIQSSRAVGRRVDRSSLRSNAEPASGNGGQKGARGLGGLGWLGIGLTAGGAVSLGGAVWMDSQVGRARSDAQAAREAGESERADDIYRDRIRPQQTAGRVLLGVGGGLAVGGLSLWIADLVSNPSRDEGSGAADRGLEWTPRVTVDRSVGTIGIELRTP
jgi:tetratricopeptide (TPR) repeat protein